MLAPQSKCVKILRYERNLLRHYVKVDISKPEIFIPCRTKQGTLYIYRFDL